MIEYSYSSDSGEFKGACAASVIFEDNNPGMSPYFRSHESSGDDGSIDMVITAFTRNADGTYTILFFKPKSSLK